MVKSAAVAALLAVPTLVLSACSPDQHATTSTGSTPPTVWTGSTSPGATPSAGPAGPSATPAGAETLTAQLVDSAGKPVATATFVFADGVATVTVESRPNGILKAGFHGLHVHAVGECKPDSPGPDGAVGDFNSAGGHFQAPGRSAQPVSGDLSSLQVRTDGSAMLVTTTDAFTAQQLLDGKGTAIIIHEKADNFANIPDRYSIDGTPGPDAKTRATGDAGDRVACGVIKR